MTTRIGRETQTRVGCHSALWHLQKFLEKKGIGNVVHKEIRRNRTDRHGPQYRKLHATIRLYKECRSTQVTA